jgi:hypothetical protein
MVIIIIIIILYYSHDYQNHMLLLNRPNQPGRHEGGDVARHSKGTKAQQGRPRNSPSDPCWQGKSP